MSDKEARLAELLEKGQYSRALVEGYDVDGLSMTETCVTDFKKMRTEPSIAPSGRIRSLAILVDGECPDDLIQWVLEACKPLVLSLTLSDPFHLQRLAKGVPLPSVVSLDLEVESKTEPPIALFTWLPNLRNFEIRENYSQWRDTPEDDAGPLPSAVEFPAFEYVGGAKHLQSIALMPTEKTLPPNIEQLCRFKDLVDVSFRSFGDTGVQAFPDLIAALAELPLLTKFSLSNSRISTSCCPLRDWVSKSSSLQSLTLSNCKTIDEPLTFVLQGILENKQSVLSDLQIIPDFHEKVVVDQKDLETVGKIVRERPWLFHNITLAPIDEYSSFFFLAVTLTRVPLRINSSFRPKTDTVGIREHFVTCCNLALRSNKLLYLDIGQVSRYDSETQWHDEIYSLNLNWTMVAAGIAALRTQSAIAMSIVPVANSIAALAQTDREHLDAIKPTFNLQKFLSSKIAQILRNEKSN